MFVKDADFLPRVAVCGTSGSYTGDRILGAEELLCAIWPSLHSPPLPVAWVELHYTFVQLDAMILRSLSWDWNHFSFFHTNAVQNGFLERRGEAILHTTQVSPRHAVLMGKGRVHLGETVLCHSVSFLESQLPALPELSRIKPLSNFPAPQISFCFYGVQKQRTFCAACKAWEQMTKAL